MPMQGRRCLWGFTRCLQRPLAGCCPTPPCTIRNGLSDSRLHKCHSVFVTSSSLPASSSVSIRSSSGNFNNGWHSSLLRGITPCRTLCRLGVSLRPASAAVTNPVFAAGPPRTAVRAATPASIRLAAESKPHLNRRTAKTPEATASAATPYEQPPPYHPLAFGRYSAAQGGALNITSYSPVNRNLLCVGGETTRGQWTQELQRTQKKQQQQACQQQVHRQLCLEPYSKATARRPFIRSNDNSNQSGGTSSSCIEPPGFCHLLEATAVLATAAATPPASAAETDHPCIEGQHSEALRRGQGPNAAVAATLTAPPRSSGPAPATEGRTHCIAGRKAGRADHIKTVARAFPVGDSGGTGSPIISSPVASTSAVPNGASISEAKSASGRDTLSSVPKPNNSEPNGTPTAAAGLGSDALAIVPACSSCSLSSASVWKKWLLLLCETEPQRLQELLLKFPPICKKHNKNLGASGQGRLVVSFRQLLRLLEAAALHPHATEASVSVLRQRLRLGVEQQADGTVAAVAGASGVPASSKALAPVNSAAAAQVARRLAYVEGGLALLALEKGAQLMQSLRDFDCADSFLLEATAKGAPARVGYAAPRWNFKALEGPLHEPPSRQKSVWQQLESGSLLILKPVDETSALLAKELRLLHGDSFDFSCVIAQVAAAAAELTVDSAPSRPVVAGTTPSYKGDEQRLSRMQRQPLPPVLQKLLRVGGGKHLVRCVVCGGSLIVSAEELLRDRLACSDCAASSAAVKATGTSTSGTARTQAQFCGAPCRGGLPASSPSSLMNHMKPHEQFEYGNLLHVLKQLETATSWEASRFALESPAFIASVCSSSRLPNIKVRVHPFPEALPHDFGSCGSNAEAFDAAEAARGRCLRPANPQLQRIGVDGLTLAPGSRFWAMPVSFIAAVHNRQVESLARLAETSSLQLLPAEDVALASTSVATRASAASAHLWENPILKVLTTTAGDDTYGSVQAPACRPPLTNDNEAAPSPPLPEEHAPAAVHGTTFVDAPASAEAKTSEIVGKASKTSLSFLTPRQREAVSAATSQGTRIVTVEGPPGTGKTAVAASIVREWLSKCTYTSTIQCEDAQCACREPIFVAAGTHAALRSLKNKLDQEGVETVRLSDEGAVLDALQAETPPHRGHRLAKLKLKPRRVLVDESSQLTEFAALGALVNGADLVVLIGDERQLPPASALSPSASPRSLFSALKGGACRSVLLNLQFRMPPLLAAFISSHFYDGKLLTHPSRAGLLSPHESLLPSKQPQQQQQQFQRWPLQASEGADMTPLFYSRQQLIATSPVNGAATQGSSGTRGIVGKMQCKDSVGVSRTAAVKYLDTVQDVCSFPWPDGSEGDKELAQKLMEQLGAHCKSSERARLSSGWAQELHCYPIPDVLPILFLDTSPWASGPSRRLAKITLPSVAPEGAAATYGLAVAGPSRSTDVCKTYVKSLPAEQRVKSSLQNPLEAFMVYRCVEMLLSCGASKQDIAVLTPYQAQAQLLSRVLHPAALDVLDERCRPHPQVFTVDGFQGHEREYIILSTVKGCRKSAREFFLFDPRRINVALSRASRGLIIVGNANALAEASPTWSSFLLFLRTLGAALPLDHHSLKKSLTKGLLLPRQKPSQALKQDPLGGLNPSKRMPPEEGEHGDLALSAHSVETS